MSGCSGPPMHTFFKGPQVYEEMWDVALHETFPIRSPSLQMEILSSSCTLTLLQPCKSSGQCFPWLLLAKYLKKMPDTSRKGLASTMDALELFSVSAFLNFFFFKRTAQHLPVCATTRTNKVSRGDIYDILVFRDWSDNSVKCLSCLASMGI